MRNGHWKSEVLSATLFVTPPPPPFYHNELLLIFEDLGKRGILYFAMLVKISDKSVGPPTLQRRCFARYICTCINKLCVISTSGYGRYRAP